MTEIKTFKSMVLAMTTQGIDVKAALDAAEVALFGQAMTEAVKSKNDMPRRQGVDIDSVYRAKNHQAERFTSHYQKEADLAKRIGLTTQSFNKALQRKGYLKKVPLLNKPLPETCKHSATWALTESGKLYGKAVPHVNYKDGTPAIHRHKWDPKILQVLAER